jgi:nitronate monooxygenase/enoyl-[acyl-carrier protein] reductase II
MRAMLKTPLCDLLGIDHPIIQAGMGTVPSAALVAAVSNAGALGTFSTFLRPADDTRRQLAMLQDLTSRPFAVNHVVQAVDEETFGLGLAAQPKLVSMALADPGDFVKRAHDAGALFMQQVTTVAQAVQAAERGVDIIVAQGGESGGYGGMVSTLVLVPQVVDAVRPLPVVAAGGIYDGRGLAAALVLGAAGVNVGTRFLASAEAAPSVAYKRVVTSAASEDSVKVPAFNDILPYGKSGYGTVLRSIKTPWVDELAAKPGLTEEESERAGQQLMDASRADALYELLPTAGQSSGGITEVLPAAEIVSRIIAEAELALAQTWKP